MSIITLQFGQCGNQIGQKLYSIINDDITCSNTKSNTYNSSAINRWFHVNKKGNWEPRSILIDTESKVVDNNNHLSFKFKNIVAKSYGGSANNWAYGYCERSKLLQNEVCETVRKEMEKCDFVASFLNLFSSSGGTGSGVGSSILRILRDEYPNKNLTNAIVLPYNNGEIVTQNYNSLLCLSSIYSISDSIILFENERLHYIYKYSTNKKEITFKDLNLIIAQQLASLYQPLNYDLNSLINNLTSHNFKYLQISNEPHFIEENKKFEVNVNWKPLIQNLSKRNRYDIVQYKQNNLILKTIYNLLITRGGNLCNENDLKPFKDDKNYVPWLNINECFKSYHQTRHFCNIDKYLTLVSNNNSVYLPLNSILDDAWNLFTHGAYLHHYKTFGIDEEYFLNCFNVMENLLNKYKIL